MPIALIRFLLYNIFVNIYSHLAKIKIRKDLITMKKFLAAALALCMTSAAFSQAAVIQTALLLLTQTPLRQTLRLPIQVRLIPKVFQTSFAEYPASTEKIDVKNGATENMIARSVINEGDTSPSCG